METSDIASYRIKEINVIDDSDIHIKIKLVVLSNTVRKPLVIEEIRKGSLPLLKVIHSFRAGELTCKEAYSAMNEQSPVLVSTGAFNANNLTDETIHEILSSIYNLPNEQSLKLGRDHFPARSTSVTFDTLIDDESIISPFATDAVVDKPIEITLHDRGGNTVRITDFKQVSNNHLVGSCIRHDTKVSVDIHINTVTGKMTVDSCVPGWWICGALLNVVVDFEYAVPSKLQVVSPIYSVA